MRKKKRKEKKMKNEKKLEKFISIEGDKSADQYKNKRN